ncbi:TetR/AcrR family transcriptional regulator [Demequina capsici]|uniref:TetR/AcrR family transcriptional regulator n=1 Tax=Demequina capsici TaxID=3075620 RepID=A0AA96F5F6_9MICO|nr:TetR/AcrR family transcriptional regulator [Demequina sp. OYTSA14]WNM23749.1 TetR/AcrR family transcriptional regulator [Demequina sp. OYTSA14]
MSESPARRRRAAELEDAIRDAVREELDERGYAGVTFEGVARRAGTSKPVVYRRYDSRAQMVIDAVIARGFSMPRPPFVGPLRDDLVLFMRSVMTRIGKGRVQTFRGVIGEVDDATVAHVARVTLEFANGMLDEVFASARARGELGPAPVPPRVAGSIVALLRHYFVFEGGDVGSDAVDEIVDQVLVPLLKAVTAVPTDG